MKKEKGFYERIGKRLFDILLSGTALIILSPIILIVAILVRKNLGSPVIFKQLRPGRSKKLFSMYKFRTMTDARDINGDLLPDANRLTPFGKFLRSTSLDELPELWNIFVGNMSIVGPRPLLIHYLPYYSETEQIRHNVRPGLTGLAQVNGRNNTPWDERLYYDVSYVRDITFKNDIKIVLKTIFMVMRRQDIAVGTELKMENLDVERKNQLPSHD